ncbi:MAG TPA: putative molybdenum carrier protein [Methylocella sp.]|nr:putative molybdenum carrier protein [Methylocella sp.]
MVYAASAIASLRIRSGGQTGVDRAALDAALMTGLAYEGWCPKGGLAEDLASPPGLLKKYPCLKETPSPFPEQRTEWNVRDGDSTVVLVPHVQFYSKGTAFTIECAKKYGKTCTVIHYLYDGAAAQLKDIISALKENASLNIAGPRESEHPGAYDLCLPLLAGAFAGGRRQISAPRATNGI